jgi:hypothetical protein
MGPPASPTPETYSTPIGELTTEQADTLLWRKGQDPKVSAILESNLPTVEKRQQALAALFNSDIDQATRGKGPEAADLDRGNSRGEVVAAPDLRDEADFTRYLAQQAKVSPEVATSARDILTKQPDIRPSALQQAVKAATGQSLALKPASVLASEFKVPSAYASPTEAAPSGPPLWGAANGPPSIPAPMWQQVLNEARSTPAGKTLTVPQLRGLGLSLKQATDAREALRQTGTLQGIDDTREGPVPYSNVLAPTNALNFLRNEVNGKNYGCM